MKKIVFLALAVFVIGFVYYNKKAWVHEYCLWKRESHDRAVVRDYRNFLEERSQVRPFKESKEVLVDEYTKEAKKTSLNIAKECFVKFGLKYPYLDDYYRPISL